MNKQTYRKSKKEMTSDYDKTATSYPINVFVLFVAGIAAIGGILFGFDTGVISGAILFIKKQYHLSAFYNGIVVSASLIGAVFGSASSGWSADYFGRKRTLMFAALIFMIGTLGSAFAINIPNLILSRFILGVAIGIASFTAPLYISEIAPSRIRGALVSLNQLAVTVGIFVSYFVDEHYAKTDAWRWMFGMGVIPAGFLFLGLIFLPLSPRWLCSKGRMDEAFNTLRRIRRSKDIDAEFSAIKASLEQEGGWRDLFRKWLRQERKLKITFIKDYQTKTNSFNKCRMIAVEELMQLLQHCDKLGNWNKISIPGYTLTKNLGHLDEQKNIFYLGHFFSNEYLTKREFEVFKYLLCGNGVTEIAIQLARSIKTIQSQIRSIANKLRCSHQHEIVPTAIKYGLTHVVDEIGGICCAHLSKNN